MATSQTFRMPPIARRYDSATVANEGADHYAATAYLERVLSRLAALGAPKWARAIGTYRGLIPQKWGAGWDISRPSRCVLGELYGRTSAYVPGRENRAGGRESPGACAECNRFGQLLCSEAGVWAGITFEDVEDSEGLQIDIPATAEAVSSLIARLCDHLENDHGRRPIFSNHQMARGGECE